MIRKKRPVIYAFIDSHGKFKGNVDAELVLHSAAIEFPHYDQAIIVAGDGNYHCLLEYLESKSKLYKLIIPNRYSESRLLSKFQSYKIFLYRERNNLAYAKKMGGVTHKHVVYGSYSP